MLMTLTRQVLIYLTILLAAPFVSAAERETASRDTAAGDSAAKYPASFYRAHYAAHVECDLDAAEKLFRDAAEARGLSDAQRKIVQDELDSVHERQIARTPARLCPANAVAFVELHRPGELIERLTTMLGIPTEPVLAERQSKGAINWEQFNPTALIPDRVVMSPALMKSLKRFEGAALALTDLSKQGGGDVRGEGILILNPGDDDAMRGLIEMAAQFGPADQPIDGFPAFQFPEGVSAVMTHRLIIVGSSRGDVEAAVARLKNGGDNSLAASERFARLCKSRRESTLTLYVDAQRALELAKPYLPDDDEFHAARALLDLDNLLGASLGVGAIDGGLGLDLSVMLNEGHHNLVYNLVRTPAMSRKALACVPGNAGLVFGFGLNPAGGSVGQAISPFDESDGSDSGPADGRRRGSPDRRRASSDRKAKALQSVTGLDIFREIFGNIEEICVYAAPRQGGLFGKGDNVPAQIPNGALIIAAGDAGKSQALWTQLLSIPSMVMRDKAAPPEEVEIGGRQVTAFALPEVGRIYLGRAGDCLVVSARREAVAAVFKTASGNGKSVLDDAALQPAVSRLHPDVGLVLIAHAGRLVQIGAGVAAGMHGGDGPPPAMMNALLPTLTQSLDSTVLYVALTQSETELNLRLCVAGLPNVNELLKQAAPLVRMIGGGMDDSGVSPRPKVAQKRKARATAKVEEDEDELP